MIKFWNPSKQYLAHKEEFDAEMQRVLTAGDLILRDDVEKFEKELAEFLGVKYVIGVASGTDALVLSMKALGIGAGDEVVTSAYTFRGTVEAIHHTGATPVLADMGESFTNTEKIRAVIPAHIAGEIRTIPPKNQGFFHPFWLVEDACQAISARPLMGIAACYSFYPAKILGCFGDGGAIATNDDEFAVKVRKMRNHYKDDWSGYGYNSRLDNLQAAVLRIKLKYLPDVIKRRKEIAVRYDEILRRKEVAVRYNEIFKQEPRDIYQDYIAELWSNEERDRMQAYFASQGIETMKNEYPFPAGTPKLPKAADYESRTLRLPCNETLTDEEVEYIISKIKEYGK